MLELLLALGILVILGGSVILITRPGLARDESISERNVTHLLGALADWRGSHEKECPTLGLLEAEGFLEPNARRDDAWGGTYRVDCEGGELTLVSAGPDGKPGTKDDVRIAPH